MKKHIENSTTIFKLAYSPIIQKVMASKPQPFRNYIYLYQKSILLDINTKIHYPSLSLPVSMCFLKSRSIPPPVYMSNLSAFQAHVQFDSSYIQLSNRIYISNFFLLFLNSSNKVTALANSAIV